MYLQAFNFLQFAVLAFGKLLPLLVFTLLSDVKAFYRPVITHHSGVDQALGSLLIWWNYKLSFFHRLSFCFCLSSTKIKSSHCGQYSCSPFK